MIGAFFDAPGLDAKAFEVFYKATWVAYRAKDCCLFCTGVFENGLVAVVFHALDQIIHVGVVKRGVVAAAQYECGFAVVAKEASVLARWNQVAQFVRDFCSATFAPVQANGGGACKAGILEPVVANDVVKMAVEGVGRNVAVVCCGDACERQLLPEQFRFVLRLAVAKDGDAWGLGVLAVAVA